MQSWDLQRGRRGSCSGDWFFVGRRGAASSVRASMRFHLLRVYPEGSPLCDASGPHVRTRGTLGPWDPRPRGAPAQGLPAEVSPWRRGGFAGSGCSVSLRLPAPLRVLPHCWKRRLPVLGGCFQAADQRLPSRLRLPRGPPGLELVLSASEQE